MKPALSLVSFCTATLSLVASICPSRAENYTSYVNPFIGTTNFGATNPGAICPNGMMSVVPFNVMGSEDNLYDKDARWWSTPYERHNSFFTGFAHGALSGVGCPDLGSLLTMATTGELDVDYHNYGSNYSNEQATPGYYSLSLGKYGILAETTATERTSIERYTFPKGQGNILINLGEGLTNESGAMVRKVSDTEIEGMKLFGTFGYTPQAVFPVYFVMRVSRLPSDSGYWKKQPPKYGVEAQWDKDSGKYKLYHSYGRELAGDDVGYWFSFNNLLEGEQIEVRMGISYVSIENARLNLETEQHFSDNGRALSFDEVRKAASEKWNSLLGRIRIQGGTHQQRIVFYTALYHALIHPNILNDVNGEYPIMEHSGKTGHTDKTRYTVFSLWDTYRNLHQLLTLVYPEKQIDMLRSMVGMYEEWGWLPKWELYGRETFVMEGDPAVPVIVDSWMKGLRDFDIEKAYEAMCKSAFTNGENNPLRPDNDPYMSKGYIPLGFYSADLSGDNSVAHSLEYYVADNALALLADSLGHHDKAQVLKKRSLGYHNYYDHEYGCFRPIQPDGQFLSPFNPRQGENFEPVPGFHEGSAWNYTFYVPHDIPGLAKLMGGKRQFISKLQKIFDEGLYDPANEPDIAYPYLFSRFRGEEWRTWKLTSTLLTKHFRNAPDGIPGNDDTGVMSAWAIFTMLGFYPDCPGEPYYTLTIPTFDRAEIDTEYGTIVIEKPDGLDGSSVKRTDNVRVLLDGHRLGKLRISHKELVEGKSIVFKK